jgi:hypothetical protein
VNEDKEKIVGSPNVDNSQHRSPSNHVDPTKGTGGTGGAGFTGGTGGTGGTGFIGSTGASGLGGDVGKAINSIMDMNESVEDFAKHVAYAGLYGATGGAGGIGTLEEIQENVSLADISKKFSKQIGKLEDTEEILKDFNECQGVFNLVMSKTNAVNAYFAFMQGKRLLKLQSIRINQNSRDWIKWITAKLPNLKKRTREKYMSLAAVPGVENHFEYGVERLAEFGVIYSPKSETEKTALGSAPFSNYMKSFNLEMGTSHDERKNYVDAVIEVNKLNRIKVEFPLDVMINFLRVQDTLTAEERKHLKKLYDENQQKPVDLLTQIIAKELNRKNFIAGTDTPSSETGASGDTQKASIDTSTDDSLTGLNIDRMVSTLCKSLKPVASNTAKLDGKFDRDALVQLKVYIEQLLELPQDAQTEAA